MHKRYTPTNEDKESFIAFGKKTGKKIIFKTKDNRDNAVSAGTHVLDKDNLNSKKKKTNGSMFTKDSGYDSPDTKDKSDKLKEAIRKVVREIIREQSISEIYKK